jgi:hypothetical protein
MAWKFFKKRVYWYKWDYGTPFYGTICWVLLISFDIGAIVSLSNLVVETFWIGIASIASPWIRVAFPGKNKKTFLLSSVFSLIIPITVAVLIRLLMPTLPE